MTTEDIGMKRKMNVKCFKDINLLKQGNKIDETQIFELVDFVNKRYDCADFRMICLIKTYYYYRDNLSSKCVNAIKDAILKFKYWMDEPGNDGMCYWSENHQLLFAACELLSGALFQNEVFLNNGMTGQEHYYKAHKKILRWLDYKFKYGFIEWHSNTYYEEDIAPLCVLVDCAKDEEIVKKSTIILDLLFFDLALHSFNGYFVASSGRCYSEQKKDPENADVNDILAYAFGIQKRNYDYERISSMFILSEHYQVPEIIKDIALEKGPMIISDAMGFNLKTINKEIKDGSIDDRGMVIWQMEAFTNPRAITNTLKIFNDWKLYDNNFLQDFKMINKLFLIKLHLLPLVTKILHPMTDGVAIERADVETYKAPYYMLSTAQNYHPREFGDQQHIYQASLKGINVFSTNPSQAMFDDPARNFSPSYWVGNGVNPFALQHKNVLLLGYKLNVRKGFMERGRQKMVHFFFPIQKFNRTVIKEKEAFGEKDGGYIGILANSKLSLKDNNEIQFFGKILNFAVVMGDITEYETFEDFIKSFDDATLSGNGSKTELNYLGNHYYGHYKKGLYINRKKIKIVYDRLETPYVNSKRAADEIIISHGSKKLVLNFNKQLREEK